MAHTLEMMPPPPPKAVNSLDTLDKAGSHSECQEKLRTKASAVQHSLDFLAELCFDLVLLVSLI